MSSESFGLKMIFFKNIIDDRKNLENELNLLILSIEIDVKKSI